MGDEAAGKLRAVLGPWLTEDTGRGDFFRFHDAPPAVVRVALSMSLPEQPVAAAERPPTSELVELAETTSGCLTGHVRGLGPAGRLTVDGLAVPADRLPELLLGISRIRETGTGGRWLALATAEIWSGWGADEPAWVGTGDQLADVGHLGEVVGLWWD